MQLKCRYKLSDKYRDIAHCFAHGIETANFPTMTSLLSSLNLIGHSIFKLESGNRNVDGQTNRQKQTNERTELHQFQKEPSYDGDLCPCQV